LKLPIALRLFFAVLLTACLVAASGLSMLRVGVERSFGRYVTEIELGRLSLLASQLEGVYGQHGAWPALSAAERPGWLGAQFARLRDTQLGALATAGLLTPDGKPMPPPPVPHGTALPWPPPDRLALYSRIGLLDADGRLLSGLQAPDDSPRRQLSRNGVAIGYLTLAMAADPSDALVRTFIADQSKQLTFIGLSCLLLSALAAGLLAMHFRRPIVKLVAAARTLTAGHFDARVDIERSDELGMLARSFNLLARMLEQHESSRRQWVADTSHELRTPLAVLRAQVEALQDGVRQPSQEQFAAMHSQVQSLSRLIDELYELARADIGQLDYHMAEIDPWPVVAEQVESFRDRLQAAGLRLQVQPTPAACLLRADADRLRQIVANLLENALRYTDSGGCIGVRTQCGRQYWTLVIEDSAPSVPPAALGRLGERFFRVEASRSRAYGGSGLGLALCQRIAQAHRGGVRFAPSPLGGLQVSVDIGVSLGGDARSQASTDIGAGRARSTGA
jgi:two-component system sensor histidine kinase BaeS